MVKTNRVRATRRAAGVLAGNNAHCPGGRAPESPPSLRRRERCRRQKVERKLKGVGLPHLRDKGRKAACCSEYRGWTTESESDVDNMALGKSDGAKKAEKAKRA